MMCRVSAIPLSQPSVSVLYTTFAITPLAHLPVSASLLERQPGEDPCDKGSQASLVAQTLKSLPEMWKTRVRSLGWEDSPGEGNGNPL